MYLSDGPLGARPAPSKLIRKDPATVRTWHNSWENSSRSWRFHNRRWQIFRLRRGRRRRYRLYGAQVKYFPCSLATGISWPGSPRRMSPMGIVLVCGSRVWIFVVLAPCVSGRRSIGDGSGIEGRDQLDGSLVPALKCCSFGCSVLVLAGFRPSGGRADHAVWQVR
jgi:hypothetical protein